MNGGGESSPPNKTSLLTPLFFFITIAFHIFLFVFSFFKNFDSRLSRFFSQKMPLNGSKSFPSSFRPGLFYLNKLQAGRKTAKERT